MEPAVYDVMQRPRTGECYNIVEMFAIWPTGFGGRRSSENVKYYYYYRAGKWTG